jgi:hypothetical protein
LPGSSVSLHSVLMQLLLLLDGLVGYSAATA